MAEDRSKILDKAKKLKELADRGVGGEKDTAERMLIAYKEKHGIKDYELSEHKFTENSSVGRYTKEQFYAMMAADLEQKGLHVMAKGYTGLMKNQDTLNQFRNKAANAQKQIRWEHNEKNFSFKGFIGSKSFFDIQETKNGATLYRAGKEKLSKEKDFVSIDEAKSYCESIKERIDIYE